MHKVLLCILFAAFALMMMFIVLAEATLAPDATVTSVQEAEVVNSRTVEFVVVNVAPSFEAEQPRDRFPRDEAETAITMNEAAEVERSGGGPVRPGGV